MVRSSAAMFAALVLALGGCGGGGDGDVAPPVDGGGTTPPPAAVPVAQALATASADPANDTSVNSTASFKVLQAAGVPAFQAQGPAKVNFAVFSGGQLVKNLTISSVSFALAKLVPGSNGEPDQWVNYIYRTESTASGSNRTGPGGVPVLASAVQATSDPKQSDPALAAQQFALHPDGYYTYTFRTDIKDPSKTNGVVFEPGRTHRVAIQLSYQDAAGQQVRVNPYFDFTVDASGNSVPVTDPAQTRKMVDIATCNGCHDRLAIHGGGRVDTQFCVMCHNPGTTDANSGNVLNMATMVHKIHAGRLLHEQGEDYVIWGFSASKHDYSEVGFPKPIRDCVACHDGANPETPQGDNWKGKPSKEACLTCHQSGETSAFHVKHATEFRLGANAAAMPNSICASCHGAGSPLNAEKAHWIQEKANAANYEVRIEGVSLKTAATATTAGKLSVKYAVVNPATGAAYDLREGCTGAATTDSAGNSIVGCSTNYRFDAVLPPTPFGKPQDKFGTFTVYLGTENVPGVRVDDTTATGSLPAYRGVVDANLRYTADVTIPAGSTGNARVMILGSVAERRLDPVTRAPVGAVPPASNDDLAYVPVENAIMDVNIATGAAATAATARRAIVSNDNCNSCHGILGLPMSSQKVAFHKGVRNNADGCAVCHNANQAGGYTLMADGSRVSTTVGDSQLADNFDPATQTAFMHESYQAKRFVHGIHYGAKRNYPFTHCMNVGGEYNKDGTNKAPDGPSLGEGTCVDRYPGSTLNFTAEVAYPSALKNCSNCHVNDSWKQDRSVLGSVVFKPTGAAMLDWLVISPKAATCTTCHDAKSVQTHVLNVGASFGNFTQRDLLIGGKVFESCEGCHAPGSPLGTDIVHAYK